MRVRLAIILLLTSVISWAQTLDNQYVSPTKYDYSQVARQITAGCNSKYEQAKAIYRWLCDNISYDTSLSIFTADECWEKQKGVCQAYSELFYRLAEPLGLKTFIVGGIAKDPINNTTESHAWVFVIVEGENTGILIDPTWGAGSVSGTTFKRSENDNSWFQVDPYWLIFTHLPDDDRLQMLPDPIGRTRFNMLPALVPMWGEYGFDGKWMFDRCMAGNTDLPKVFNSGVGKILIAEMPMQSTLRVGERYRIAMQKLQQCDVAVIAGGTMYNDWQVQGNTYYLEFMPTADGEAHIGVQQSDGKYATVALYNIAEPTAADLARLEAANPFLMPELTKLPNYDMKALQKYDFDGKELLAAVRSGKVTSLPLFYGTDADCAVTAVPLNGTLRVGQSYTIAFKPQNGVEWAVINEDVWFREWSVNESTGEISMTVTPVKAGKVVIAARLADGKSFEACIGYTAR